MGEQKPVYEKMALKTKVLHRKPSELWNPGIKMEFNNIQKCIELSRKSTKCIELSRKSTKCIEFIRKIIISLS